MFAIEAHSLILEKLGNNAHVVEDEQIQESKEHFVQTAFFQHRCREFVPLKSYERVLNNNEEINETNFVTHSSNSVDTNQKCHSCGYVRSEHQSNDGRSHVVDPCSDFGTVTFVENGTTADFIRVAAEHTNVKDLASFICHYCINTADKDNMDLILSLHGTFDTGYIDNEDICQSTTNLVQGLSTLLMVSNGWVIGSGLESQNLFSRLSIERRCQDTNSTKQFQFTSIGFTIWNSVNHRQVLSKQDNDQIRAYPSINAKMKNDCLTDKFRHLSSNQTHHVLADCATESKEEQRRLLWNVRSKFEERIQCKRDVPVLNLFGAGTASDALCVLQKLRKLEHVILVGGLGGFCDEMISFLKNPDSEKVSSDHADVWTSLIQFQNDPKLHIIDLVENDSYNKVIQYAYEVVSPSNQMKLAVYDKRSGSLEYLLSKMKGRPKLITECVEVFQQALIEGNLDLVERMLLSELDIEKYFDEDFIQQLYISTITYNSPLRSFINKHAPLKLKHDVTLFRLEFLDKLLRNIVKIPKRDEKDLEMNRQLFIFSILQLDETMSQFFWKRCEEPMTAAIFGKVLLHEMRRSRYFKQEKLRLKRMRDSYEQKASKMLNLFHDEDPSSALKNLKREQSYWYDFKPLDLADRGGCINFFSQWPVSKLESDLFYGNILRSASWFKVVLCILTVLPSFFFLPWTVTHKGSHYVMKGKSVENYSGQGSLWGKKNKSSRDKRAWRIGFRLLLKTVYTTPIAKYTIDTSFNLVIVILQSYLLLKEVQLDQKVSTYEWVLFGIMILGLVKNVGICLWYECTKWKYRLQFYYISNLWNLVLLFHCGFFIIATILHSLTWEDKDAFDWVQILHIMSLILSFFILLRSLLIWKYIGPYLIVMKKVTTDVILFLVMVFIFTVCYGVCLQSVLYSNNDDMNTWSLIHGTLFKPFLHIFRENFLETFAQSGRCDYSSSHLFENCQLSYFRPVFALLLFLAFSFVVNILLINLLIAVFANSYKKTYYESNCYWNLIYYRIAVKYYSKPYNYPSPIFIILFIVSVCKYIWKQLRLLFGKNTIAQMKKSERATATLLHKQSSFRAKQIEKMVFQRHFINNDPKMSSNTALTQSSND